MFRTVLVPLDGSPLAEQALPYAREVAQRFQAKLVLLQVVPLVGQAAALGFAGTSELAHTTPPDIEALSEALGAEVRRAEGYLGETARKLQEAGLEVEWEVRRGVPAAEIIACARDRGVDLIAISTHGRSGLGRLIFGSVADEVLRKSGLPILLIKPERHSESDGDA